MRVTRHRPLPPTTRFGRSWPRERRHCGAALTAPQPVIPITYPPFPRVLSWRRRAAGQCGRGGRDGGRSVREDRAVGSDAPATRRRSHRRTGRCRGCADRELALIADLAEAGEQQTATAEVLRTIASSPTDLHVVLDELIASAVRLAGAESGAVLRVQDDHLFLVASAPEEFNRTVQARRPEPGAGHPLTPDSFAGRAFLTGRTIHVPDVLAAIESDFPDARATFAGVRNRSAVAVPLMRQGSPIGILGLHRHSEVRAFTEQQVALLETFADQAVIAIENARLFEELEQRNAELQESHRQVTEALEQQTATSEVLRVIASSPTDAPSVLQAVLNTAARLCDAPGGDILQIRMIDRACPPRGVRSAARPVRCAVSRR